MAAVATWRWPECPNESQRLHALQPYRVLVPNDPAAPTDAAQVLDALATFGAEHFGGGVVCCISLITEEHQTFVGCSADIGRVSPRELSFCTYGLVPEFDDSSGGTFSIVDASLDERFARQAVEHNLRFYAGAPLIHPPSGSRLGMLCLYGDQPRQLRAEEKEQLKAAASVVMGYLDELAAASSSSSSFQMPAAADARARMAAAIAAPSAAAAMGEKSPPALRPPTDKHDKNVKCLGWSALPAPADRLSAELRDACMQLGARPIMPPYPVVDERYTFRVEADQPEPLALVVSLSPVSEEAGAAGGSGGGGGGGESGASEAYDVRMRRIKGDQFTYFSFLKRLQGQLAARLPDLPASQLVLCRT